MGRYGTKIGKFTSHLESFFIDGGGIELRAGSSNCGTNPKGEEINDSQ